MSISDSILQQITAELRPSVQRRGAPVLIPYTDKFKYPGFSSVYGYSPEATKTINESKSTANLNNIEVYSDMLLVDFDNNESAAYEMALKLSNFHVEVYTSGNRSIHLHIKIEPMYGNRVPQIQKAWMEKYFPLADLSIYRASAIYRNPGTFHEKNPGHRKRLISEFSSINDRKLKIEDYTRPVVSTTIDEEVNTLPERLDYLLNIFKLEGGRNEHLYKLAVTMKNSNVTYVNAYELVNLWNNNFCSPSLTTREIDTVLNWAYQRRD